MTSGLHGYSTNNIYLSVINTNVPTNISLHKKFIDAAFPKQWCHLPECHGPHDCNMKLHYHKKYNSQLQNYWVSMFVTHADFMKAIFTRYKINSSAKFILVCFTVPAINEQPQIYFITPDYTYEQES